MLRQAAAMLIPFPAAIAAEFGRDPLPLSLRLSAFAGAAVPALYFAVIGVAGGGFASDRRLLARTVHASREV
jgi:hypothetical protein